jgi:hypothetical protein
MNDFDETLRNSIKKTTHEPFDFDYSLLDQPVKKKKTLYVISVFTGAVAANVRLLAGNLGLDIR